MSDNVQFEAKSEPENTNAVVEPAPTSSGEGQSVTMDASKAIMFCAVCLIASFFLPWTNLLNVKMSAMDFAKGGGAYILLWLIPIMGAITVFAGIQKQKLKAMAQVTGFLPFLFIGWGLALDGTALLQIFDFGAYLSLALGLIMFVLARKIK